MGGFFHPAGNLRIDIRVAEIRRVTNAKPHETFIQIASPAVGLTSGRIRVAIVIASHHVQHAHRI
eukprot:23869-Eustigmatos_ZCMA.PRE.1